MRFFLGTTNRYKIRELASTLTPIGIPLQVTDPIDPEETEDTFEGNAAIKAFAYGRYVGDTLATRLIHQNPQARRADILPHLRLSRTWVICEDSGLSIPALNGLPGPWSARFDDCEVKDDRIISHHESGRTRDQIDLANNERVLALMNGIAQPYRAAEFVIVLAVADIDGEILFQHRSSVTGWILEEMHGTQGFGYDPIFASDQSYGKSWAEIDSMRKNLFSHRTKALSAFTQWLATQLDR